MVLYTNECMVIVCVTVYVMGTRSPGCLGERRAHDSLSRGNPAQRKGATPRTGRKVAIQQNLFTKSYRVDCL